MNKLVWFALKGTSVVAIAVMIAAGAVYAGTQEAREASSCAISKSSETGAAKVCPITAAMSAMNPRALFASKDKGDGKPEGGCGGGTCGTQSVAAVADLDSAPMGTMMLAMHHDEGALVKTAKEDSSKPDCGGGTCGTKSTAAAATCPMADKTCDIAATCDKAGTCDMAAVGTCDMASGACGVAGQKAGETCGVAKSDLLSVAAAHHDLTLFTLAMQVAGLDEDLRSEETVTVFAPTDQAFDALGDTVLAGLLTDRAQLRQVLMQHIVSGTINEADARQRATVQTVLGSDVQLATLEGCNSLTVNGSKVIQSDLVASNGMIHAIDAVMMPASNQTASQTAPAGAEADAPAQVASVR